MIRKGVFVNVIGGMLLAGFAHAQSAVSYTSFQVKGAYYHQVTIDLNSPNVSPEVILKSRPTPMSGFFTEEQPVVAIPGTFFNTTSAYPVADVVVDGRQVAAGSRGSMIGVDWFGDVNITDTPFKQQIDLSPYRFAIRGAVRLIKDGVVCPNPRAQFFRDSRIWSRASRVAVALLHNGKLAVFATRSNVTLWELGSAVYKRGAINAVNLDGGTSTSMFYRGSYVISPGRALSNMFVVYERSPFQAPTERSFVASNW